MSLTAEALRKLAALNLSSEQMSGVLDILADMEAVEEARKAGQRERVRRHREMKRCGNVTETVVKRDSNVSPPSPPLPPTPPITPPISPQTTPDRARDGATAELVRVPDHDTLSRELIDAAGKALVNAASAPGLLVLSDPMNWIRNGCDLQADIVPAIRARCSRARPSSIRSWNYFTEAVYQARDNRLKPAPEPNVDQPPRSPRPALSSPHDVMLAALAGRAGAHAEARGSGKPDPDPEPGAFAGRTVDLVAIGR